MIISQTGFLPIGPDDHYAASYNGASEIQTVKDINGNIYCVFIDNVFYKPRVMKYNGVSWQDLGNPAPLITQLDNLDTEII